MIHRFGPLLLLASLALPARDAGASGAWTNYVRVRTCNDILATADTVLLATSEAGLVRFLRDSGTFEFVTRGPGGLASNDVTGLAYDRSGRLWAATSGRGVSRLSADGSTWDLVNAFDGLPTDSVNVVRATGDSLWIGTTGGLALWDGTQIAGSVPDLGTPSPFRSNFVSGIAVVDDSVFVGTADGAYVGRLSEGLANWTALDTGLPANRNILALATDGHEVFALAESTTYRWSMASGAWAATNPAATYVRNLRDDWGVIVCGTPAGLRRWTGSDWSAIAGSPGSASAYPSETECGVDPTGGAVAMRSGTLLLEGTPWTSWIPPGPVGNNLQHVVVDGSRIWVNSNASGVSRFDGTTWRNWPAGCCGIGQDTSFVNPVSAFALQVDRQGRKWFAFWGISVERMDDSVNPPHVDRIVYPPSGADSLYNHTAMWSSAVDSSGWIYLGGDTYSRGVRPPVGIDVYDTTGVLVNVWKAANTGLPDDQVRAIVVDEADEQIWAGVAGTGLAYASLLNLDRRTQLPSFTIVPGTSTLDVFGMVLRNGVLWVLSTTGLERRSARTGNLSSTLDLPGAPPPLGAMHPLAVSPDGTAWVGSVDGVRRYLPGGGYEDYKTSNSPLLDDEVRAVAVDPATGVAWFATAGGLSRFDPGYTPPPPPTISALHVLVYPNPAPFPAIGLELRLSGNAASYQGEIYDLNGRLVHRFSAGANGQVVWDGRDLDGRRVRPGIYFVRAHGGGHEGNARVVVLR